MGADTKVEWCHHTFNCWWGCVEDGPECDHCYARSFAKRTGHDVWGIGPRRFFGAKYWNKPLIWNGEAETAGERHRVFCGSMMDVFERRSDDVGERMDRGARKALRSHYADTLAGLAPAHEASAEYPNPLSAQLAPRPRENQIPRNVWLGTTAGTLDSSKKRVKFLLQVGPVVRFVWVEPQLEAMSDLRLDGINWLIQGGESGVRWACRSILHGHARCATNAEPLASRTSSSRPARFRKTATSSLCA